MGKDQKSHNVLQLHGGGTLVLSGIIKCAILEKITGRKINDLFQTTIADSGGAIARLCMEKVSAEELLATFISIIENTFPPRGFYYSQAFSRENRRFDNSVLRNQVKAILEDSTLADFKGNLFVGVHKHREDGQSEGGTKFSKVTKANGEVQYRTALPTTLLASIAKMTSTIPGVYNEASVLNSEHADGTYLDSIVNQHPLSVLPRIKKNNPDASIFYLQMGNIEDKNVVSSLLKSSVIFSRMRNLHWKYIVHQLHSSHLADAKSEMEEDTFESLITYGHGRFSPSDPSIDQLTRVTIETLNDIESRTEDYTDIALRLNNTPLTMSVAQAIGDLKTILDPMMKKRKLILSGNDPIPLEFPSPMVIRAEDSFFYKPSYALGRLTREFAPNVCKYFIASDFKISGAFRLACESGLKKLIPSPPNRIEPK